MISAYQQMDAVSEISFLKQRCMHVENFTNIFPLYIAPVGGSFTEPDECICNSGWTGSLCDECIPATGCCKFLCVS